MQTNQNDFKQQAPSEKDEIVLPDECGDYLWDKVLQTGNKCIYPAGSCENEGLPDNIIDKQTSYKRIKHPYQLSLLQNKIFDI